MFGCFRSISVESQRAPRGSVSSHTNVMTGHIGTNMTKFVPSRWGWLPFDPTQTGLCKFCRGFGARWRIGSSEGVLGVPSGAGEGGLWLEGCKMWTLQSCCGTDGGLFANASSYTLEFLGCHAVLCVSTSKKPPLGLKGELFNNRTTSSSQKILVSHTSRKSVWKVVGLKKWKWRGMPTILGMNFGREFLGARSPGETRPKNLRKQKSLQNSLRNWPATFLKFAGPNLKIHPPNPLCRTSGSKMGDRFTSRPRTSLQNPRSTVDLGSFSGKKRQIHTIEGGRKNRMRLLCLQLEASCLQWSFFTYS